MALPARLHHNAYVSRDLEATRHFYEDVLGLEAVLPTGETIRFGVHGPIAAHYKLDPVDPLPLPVDYVVAATGG